MDFNQSIETSYQSVSPSDIEMNEEFELVIPADLVETHNLLCDSISMSSFKLPDTKALTQLYLRKITELSVGRLFFPLALKEFQPHSLAMSRIVLPALFSKNILIRPPFPSERTKIWKKFYIYSSSFRKRSFNPVVANEGLLQKNNKIDRIFVLGIENNGKKINGAIHFTINLNPLERSCKIISISIDSKSQTQGLGTLLLSHAILIASQYNCTKVCLKTSDDAIPFYLSNAFQPEQIESVRSGQMINNVQYIKMLDDWDRGNLVERIEIAKKFINKYFYFNINQDNLNILYNRVKKILK